MCIVKVYEMNQFKKINKYFESIFGPSSQLLTEGKLSIKLSLNFYHKITLAVAVFLLLIVD